MTENFLERREARRIADAKRMAFDIASKIALMPPDYQDGFHLIAEAFLQATPEQELALKQHMETQPDDFDGAVALARSIIG